MTAAMYSFMATCKKNGVDEQQWLKDVFERIQSHKQKIFINCFQITGSIFKKNLEKQFMQIFLVIGDLNENSFRWFQR
jgi:hypothetical protein